jgi:multicomponent Na+:H+ antiporter subunit G
MSISELISLLLMIAGAIFFAAGTIGLLRFPDVYSRLHAVTKADNLGLGLIVAGLVVQAESVAVGAKLILIWLLALVAAATASHLIGNRALRDGIAGVEGEPRG